MEEALKIKQVNDEMLEHLVSSLRWLLHYSQKYGIPLPEKEKITLLVNRAMEIGQKLPTNQPTLNTSKNNREDNRTHQQKTLNSIVP